MIYTQPPEDFKLAFHAAGVFCECNGEILLLLRNPNKPQPNTWCAPGGKLEPGETSLDTAARELREEAGIDLPADSLQHCFTHYVRYPEFDMIYHCFHVTLPTQPTVIINSEEHAAYTWVSSQEAFALPLIEDEDTCIRLAYNLDPRPIDFANACSEVLDKEEQESITDLDIEECVGYCITVLIENGIEDPKEYLRIRLLLE